MPPPAASAGVHTAETSPRSVSHHHLPTAMLMGVVRRIVPGLDLQHRRRLSFVQLSAGAAHPRRSIDALAFTVKSRILHRHTERTPSVGPWARRRLLDAAARRMGRHRHSLLVQGATRARLNRTSTPPNLHYVTISSTFLLLSLGGFTIALWGANLWCARHWTWIAIGEADRSHNRGASSLTTLRTVPAPALNREFAIGRRPI